MDLRLSITDDIPEIMRLVRLIVPPMRAAGNLQWNDDYPNAEVFGRDIAMGQLWVAESHGEIAGFAALTMDQEHDYEQAGWDIAEPAIVVHRLAVNPAFQGQGVAADLMRQAERVAYEGGIAQIRVDTNSENVAMQGLLSRLNYRFVAEITLRGRTGLLFFCYEKLLPPIK